MTTYSRYGSGGIPMWQVIFLFLITCGAVVILLSMMGGAAVQVAPNPTPDRRVGGIDIDKAVEEAKLVIKDLVPGGDLGYLSSAGGFLRVALEKDGIFYVYGHNNSPGLLAAAEKIAEQLGATVGPW